MNSLLRSVVSSGGREIAVKESLVVQLSNSVKQIQLEQTKKNPFSYGCDDTASLCTVLEAIFIHGLKETFINRVTQVIGTDPDQRPEPSFWGPLLVFSHRELIDQPIHGLGFEVVPISPTSLFDIPEFGSMVQQLGKLATEPGLDVQNYTCKGCGHPIGINFAKARVCHFDGGYFCCECHAEEEWVVPARIIHNWDFKRYSVSRKAATFLDEIQHHPLLDLKIINPRIYLVVEEMAQLQALRHQLNLLRAYLFTCREPVIEDLQKRVWPREYLYEHVHLYSVADLLQSPSGNLAQILQKVVAFAKSHVLSCWLCSQKGFICEVCSNPKVIYPFDMDSTFKCGLCSAVYHIGCLNASKPCPKCVRQQKRENISEIVYS